MAITRKKKIKNSMVITRGDIERHKMVITCEITALLSKKRSQNIVILLFQNILSIFC